MSCLASIGVQGSSRQQKGREDIGRNRLCISFDKLAPKKRAGLLWERFSHNEMKLTCLDMGHVRR